MWPPRSRTSCRSLPPEGAARLWPGKAGSTAHAGKEKTLTRVMESQAKQGPRDWLRQIAGAAPLQGGTGYTE